MHTPRRLLNIAAAMTAHLFRAGLLACLLGVGAPSTHGLGVSDRLDGLDSLPPDQAGLLIFTAADEKASGYVDMQVELEMVLRNSRGAATRRALRIAQLEIPNDGDKLLVVFDTPKPIRGTALLSHGHKVLPDDQWLYLPAVKRVKKIASSNKSGPFLSSEFAYEDLIAQEVEKYSYRLVGGDTLDGAACFVVERKPVDAHSGYSRQLVWLDEAELRVQQIEYFDRRDDKLKTLTVSDYRLHAERFWKAAHMQMVNHQTGKSTALHWRNYRFATGLHEERDFSTNSLRRAR